MTEKDLFNAIDNIDSKFITDAWENSSFEFELTEVRITPERRSSFHLTFTAVKYASVAVAAAVLICLGAVAAVNIDKHISAEPLEGDSVSDESAAVGNADMVKPSESDGLSVGTKRGVLPFSVYGPDQVQLNYEDVTSVENDGVFFNRDMITDSNWTNIVCDGFAYFAKATGYDYNSVDFPDSFSDDSLFAERTFTGLDNAVWESIYGKPDLPSSYTRVSVGDNLNRVTGCDGLKLKSAKTKFTNLSSDDFKLGREDFPTATLYASSEAEFEGTVSIDGMIFKDRDGEIKFIPIGTELLKRLPIMFAVPELGKDFTSGQTSNCSGPEPYSTETQLEDRPVYYVSEFPTFNIDFSSVYRPIEEQNRTDGSIPDSDKEKVSIDDFLIGSDFAHVNITLDKISMTWSDADPYSDQVGVNGVTEITAEAVLISPLDSSRNEPYSISDKYELFKYDNPLEILDDPDVSDTAGVTRFCAFESQKYTESIQTTLRNRNGDMGQGLVYSSEFIDSLTAVIALEWTDKGYYSGPEYRMRIYLLAGDSVHLDSKNSAYRYAQINLNYIGLFFSFDGLEEISGDYYSGTYITDDYDTFISAISYMIPSEYLDTVKKMPS